jgi:hypothetical protein
MKYSIWAWLLRGLPTYLGLEVGLFLVVGLFLRKSASELAIPYLAFLVPAMILMPLVWWLRKWEEKGVSTKRLACGWGASVALFCVAVAVAAMYSGVRLGLMDSTDAVGGLLVSVLLGVPISYFTLHYMVITGAPSRAAARGSGTRPS